MRILLGTGTGYTDRSSSSYFSVTPQPNAVTVNKIRETAAFFPITLRRYMPIVIDSDLENSTNTWKSRSTSAAKQERRDCPRK
jgi:hypothetical protein